MESASRNMASAWDAFSGWGFKRKAHPGIRAWNGTHFPDGISAETASQFERLFRDAVSAEGLNWKACPTLRRDFGTCFPLGMPSGKRIPF